MHMKNSKSLVVVAVLFVAGVLAGLLTTTYAQQANGTAPLTAAEIAQLSQNVNRSVIVLMKNRFTNGAALADQAAVMDELRQVNATHVKQYRMVNAFAATVSDGELARLRANPSVAEVESDTVVRRKPALDSVSAGAGAQTASTAVNDIPGACSSSSTGQLVEAVQVTNTDSDTPGAQTARSLGFTGAGVKVAFIADGVDINNVNFIRADGTSVFSDYQDFSGDGLNAPTYGEEAFLDSNSIAGQGLQVYDVSQYSAEPDDTACYMRIEGVAPGASLVGLKAFSAFNYTTTSALLQAVEYAVLVDHVDVLNESFGSNDYPDVTSQDILKQFNDAAVALGVTVVVSSGDAGSTDTIGSPASDPTVISVGASTTMQIYAQDNEGVARDFATTGWLDDNISALSSGGYTETGNTVDLVAPGDSGWVSCDASPNYADCTNFVGEPSDVIDSGGTSMSAPLTSGAAALVIQAYRSTHGGSSPSPALIKQILTSTATNLGTPAVEQGAGLLNTYQAVLLAESIGLPNATGASLILSENQLNAVDVPGKTESWPVTVTNVSTAAQSVTVTGKTFGPEENIQSGSVQFPNGNTGASPIEIWSGLTEQYVTVNFTVPTGADRLDASIAYPLGDGYPVHLTLIDPTGKLAAYTLPQGVSGFGNVDVREPAAGTWTGVIFAYPQFLTESPTVSVNWQVYTQSFVSFGSVSSPNLTLGPGASKTVMVSASTPSAAGDADGSFVFTSTSDGTDPNVGVEANSIPVTLRSLINLNSGGAFSGVITGGNGRPNGEGQVAYYEFDVGTGHSSIAANVLAPSNEAPPIGAYLVNPYGVAVGFGTGYQQGSQALTAYTLNPVPGRWALIVDFAESAYASAISQPFTGNIQLDGENASAPELPDSPERKLKAGVPVTVPVTVTDNGAGPEVVFFDPRLNAETTSELAGLEEPNGFEYPLPLSYFPFPYWLVPSETSSLFVTAAGSVPIEFDFSPINGDPDVFGAPIAGNNAVGFYAPSGGVVQPGYWESGLSEVGPYPSSGAPAAQANVTMLARTKTFDPTVSSATGDYWLSSLNTAYSAFSPVYLQPGQSMTIDVTITPSGRPGTVVSGTLYVDDFVQYNAPYNPYNQATADEVAALPYSYTIR